MTRFLLISGSKVRALVRPPSRLSYYMGLLPFAAKRKSDRVFVVHTPCTQIMVGWRLSRKPRAEYALGALRGRPCQYSPGCDLFRQNGIGIFQPLGWTSQAKAEALTGETAAALATIERALTDADRTGRRWYNAESIARAAISCSNRTLQPGTRRRCLPHDLEGGTPCVGPCRSSRPRCQCRCSLSMFDVERAGMRSELGSISI